MTKASTQKQFLRFGYYFSPGFAPNTQSITKFAEKFETIQITTSKSTGTEALQAVKSGNVDFGLSLINDTSDINWIPALEDRFIIIKNKRWTRSDQKETKLSDLENTSRIRLDLKADDIFQKLENKILNYPEKNEKTIQVSSRESMFANLAQRNSFAILPELVAKQNDDNLAILPIADRSKRETNIPIGWAFSTHASRSAILAFKKFIQTIV